MVELLVFISKGVVPETPVNKVCPPDVIRTLSEPPVSAVIVSASGNLIAVFVSPV